MCTLSDSTDLRKVLNATIMAALDRSASGSLYQRSSSMSKTETSDTTPLGEAILVKQASQSRDRMRASPERTSSPRSEGASAGVWYRNIIIGLVGTLLVVAVVTWPSFGSPAIPGEPVPAPATEEDKWESASRALPFHLYIRNAVGRSKFLVTDLVPDVTYHRGPILTGDNRKVLKVHVIFYGAFTRAQKSIVTSFLQSFTAPKSSRSFPTVASWWAIVTKYKNSRGASVAPTVTLGTQVHDWKYSLTKSLKQGDMEKIVTSSLKKGLALDPAGVYLVLTSDDVNVQGFCSSQCGTHSSIRPSPLTRKTRLPYVWVGNSAKMCGGYCAWPFFKAAYGAGPQTSALKSPNGDAGIDGMLINVAAMLAGTATNPYGNGYFQGDARDPLEIAGVCAGIYGKNSYPGYPGELLKDSRGASFNMYGANRRKFFLPWVWNLSKKECAGQA